MPDTGFDPRPDAWLDALLHLRRIAPQTFEIVTLPHFSPHHVNDHVEIIENDPVAIDVSILSARTQFMVSAQLVINLVHDGAQVRRASAGDDDKKIRDARQLPHVQHENVLSFLVIGEFAAKLG